MATNENGGRGNWAEKVKSILIMKPEARDDDFVLYFYICEIFSNAPAWAMTFEDAMLHHKAYNMPSYEAVTRARRRVQATCPALRGKRYEKRMSQQAEYQDEFARDYR